MRDAIAVVTIASELRLDDARLEAQRLQLLRTALDRGHEASASMHAWVHQLRSEYRGSHTSWDVDKTSAELGVALDRFESTLTEVASRLRSIVPEAIDQALKGREGGS